MDSASSSPQASLPAPPPPFQWHYPEFDDGNFQLPGGPLFFITILFSAIITTLLFFYIRWLCSGLTPLAQPPPPSRGTVGNVPVVLYKNVAAEHGYCGSNCCGESECCICLWRFGGEEKVKMLPKCCHYFHSECIDKWLKTQSSCPLCRTLLLVDSPV